MASKAIRSENGIRYETRGPGDETEGFGVYCVCESCRAWSEDGKPMRHANRCDTPRAQPDIRAEACQLPSEQRLVAELRQAERRDRSAAEIQRLARDGAGLTPDEIVEAHKRSLISTSDAMNRDD